MRYELEQLRKRAAVAGRAVKVLRFGVGLVAGVRRSVIGRLQDRAEHKGKVTQEGWECTYLAKVTKHGLLGIVTLGANLTGNVARLTSAAQLVHVRQLGLDSAKQDLACSTVVITFTTPFDRRSCHGGQSVRGRFGGNRGCCVFVFLLWVP